MNLSSRPSCEDVLDAFAVEASHDRSTLEKYLRLYPEYADDIVDLSRELSRGIEESLAPLTSEDRAIVNNAWVQHAAAKPGGLDPFASLSPADWRAVAVSLAVPRQVLTALRERRVRFSSIPATFLGKFAAAINSTAEILERSWPQGQVAAGRSYKADGKPKAGEEVSFEQVLIDAGIAPEERAKLLSEVK